MVWHYVPQPTPEEIRERRQEELRVFTRREELLEVESTHRRFVERIVVKEQHAPWVSCALCRTAKLTALKKRCLTHDKIFEDRCSELLGDERLLKKAAEAQGVE
jgi:hypothetical protein